MRGRIAADASRFAATAAFLDAARSQQVSDAIWARYRILGRILTLPQTIVRVVKRQAQPEFVGIEITVEGD